MPQGFLAFPVVLFFFCHWYYLLFGVRANSFWAIRILSLFLTFGEFFIAAYFLFGRAVITDYN